MEVVRAPLGCGAPAQYGRTIVVIYPCIVIGIVSPSREVVVAAGVVAAAADELTCVTVVTDAAAAGKVIVVTWLLTVKV